MEVIIQPTSADASALGARMIQKLVTRKPNAVLGLATGSTPLKLYAELARLHREEGLDFSQVTTFNLDEYVGLSPEHISSYHYFMRENFFRHVNIPEANTHIPSGLAKDLEVYCESYEAAITAAGGIDLQILGIGGDGHVGFNEPGSSLSSRTRIKTLTERTIADNSQYFTESETVPHHVVTMGVGTIMEARTVLLLAFGSGKAEAVQHFVEGPITATVPASILQMHRKAVALLDEPAAAQLKRSEYYRWVYNNKPDWQRI